MSEHAQPQQEELKKHGDELANAFKDSDGPSNSNKKVQPATDSKKKE